MPECRTTRLNRGMTDEEESAICLWVFALMEVLQYSLRREKPCGQKKFNEAELDQAIVLKTVVS
jgi:hypothetical protein